MIWIEKKLVILVYLGDYNLVYNTLLVKAIKSFCLSWENCVKNSDLLIFWLTFHLVNPQMCSFHSGNITLNVMGVPIRQ